MSAVYKQQECRNYTSHHIQLWIDHVDELLNKAQQTRNEALHEDLEAADAKVAELTRLLSDLRQDLTTKQKQENPRNPKSRIKELIAELSNIIDSMP